MVTLNVKQDGFVDDLFSYTYAGMKKLRIVKLDEAFVNAHRNIGISGLVMQIEQSYSDSDVIDVIPCPTIIGMANAYVSVLSDDSSLVGKALTFDNIEQCYLELN